MSRAAMQAQASEVFKDDFEGDVLAEHWEVMNPNPGMYIVEDGKALVVFQDEITLDAENIPDMFRHPDKELAGWIPAIDPPGGGYERLFHTHLQGGGNRRRFRFPQGPARQGGTP